MLCGVIESPLKSCAVERTIQYRLGVAVAERCNLSSNGVQFFCFFVFNNIGGIPRPNGMRLIHLETAAGN